MPKTKKKQAQLAFVPLSPDSPASQSQPISTRSRAAAVGISPSPKPKKRANPSEHNLPTPVASSQTQVTSKTSSRSTEKDSPANKARPSFMTRSRAPASSPVPPHVSRPNANGDIIDMFDESESDGAPVITAVRATARQVPAALTGDDDDSEESDEPATQPRRLKRMPRRSQAGEDDDEDDDGNDEDGIDTDAQRVGPVQKRRRLKGPRTPRRADREEDRELREDLDFLRSDSPERPGRYLSSQKSAQRSQKLSALEALKRSRQRTRNTPNGRHNNHHIVTENDDDSNDDAAADDDENEGELVESGEGSDDDLSIVQDEPWQQKDLHEDVNDDSFIVEDDGEVAEIPMEFKMQLMKLRELFDFAVEWMCQKRLNPAFAIDDDVYTTAFWRLNDYVQGMGGSKFTSAAWTASFTRALKARPLLDDERFVNDGLHDRCDACNRSGHPPTWKVWLQGDPYDKDTLEDESEDEEDYSRETKLPEVEQTWYLGKFCMANAKTAHTLAHWRYHLYKWVVDYLDDEGYLDTERVLQRDRWNTKKRRDYANSVADQMKETGVTKRLYRDFKQEIEGAQNQNAEDYLS